MRRNNLSSRNGGPLLTDHLQLHDLDLELELLKRKREMIEKQQQMLSGPAFDRPRPFEYERNQPHTFQGIPPFNNNSNFPRYNKPQQSNGYSAGGLLGKRPMMNQPIQDMPNSYSGPQGGIKRKFNSGPPMNQSKPSQTSNNNKPSFQNRPWNKSQPNKGPKSNFPSQRFNNSRSAPAHKDFKPTKVSKPKAAGSHNKISSHNPELAKLVKQAVQTPKKDDVDPNCFVLREDKVPSQQLAGRLELALGNILKDIKAKYGNSEPFTVSFQSVFLQRQMKQAIRERLRSVMMGKYVGKVADIVEHYRKVFPVDTDAEIVKVAMDAHDSFEAKQLSIKLENAASSYKYIKHNLNRLVGVTLDEMFLKLQKMYENENESTRDICTKIINETPANVEDYIQNKEDFEQTKDATSTPNESLEVDKIEIPTEEKDDQNAAETDTKEVENEENEDQTEVEKVPDVENDEEKQKETLGPKSINSVSKLDNLILSLMRRRLPHILPKYKNMIMKVLNVSQSYHVTRDVILEKAQEKLLIDKRVQEAEQRFSENKSNIETSNEKATPVQPQPGPYMVKILGRPVLPKRKIMQNFLNEYKPSSVKKHRTMHLLFVSFANKEDFDRIVALKETTLGACTIFIKVSEMPVGKTDESLNVTASSLNQSNDDVTVSSDLDDQINDLLQSIRNEEENKDEKNDENASEPGSQDDAEAQANNEADTGTNGEAEVETNETTAEKEVTPEVTNTGTEDEKQVSEEAKDKVEELKTEVKESGRATPTRASSRLATVTPSSVRTRRASRLANN